MDLRTSLVACFFISVGACQSNKVPVASGGSPASGGYKMTKGDDFAWRPVPGLELQAELPKDAADRDISGGELVGAQFSTEDNDCSVRISVADSHSTRELATAKAALLQNKDTKIVKEETLADGWIVEYETAGEVPARGVRSFRTIGDRGFDCWDEVMAASGCAARTCRSLKPK